MEEKYPDNRALYTFDHKSSFPFSTQTQPKGGKQRRPTPSVRTRHSALDVIQDCCLLSAYPRISLGKFTHTSRFPWVGKFLCCTFVCTVSLLHISKFQLTARIHNQKLNFTYTFQSLTWLFHMCNDPVESHFSTQVACIVHSFPTCFQRKTHLCQLHNRRLINIQSCKKGSSSILSLI